MSTAVLNIDSGSGWVSLTAATDNYLYCCNSRERMNDDDRIFVSAKMSIERKLTNQLLDFSASKDFFADSTTKVTAGR